MSVAATGYRHVELDDRRIPVIAGTRFKVALLIEQMKAWGWSAEQAHEHHPHLSLAQVHSALAYYHDHRAELEREGARHLEAYDRSRQAQTPMPDRHVLEARLATAEPA